MKPCKLYIYRLITTMIPETSCFRLKATMLRWCGAKVGNNVRICSSAIFLGAGDLEIGDDVWIGSRSFISSVAPASITVGSHCDFGPEVMVLTGSHEIDSVGDHVAGKGTSAPVRIGDGCWLCARALVLPGVSLPRKTLVAAGAVVNKSFMEESRLLAGVPALVKKSLVDR